MPKVARCVRSCPPNLADADISTKRSTTLLGQATKQTGQTCSAATGTDKGADLSIGEKKLGHGRQEAKGMPFRPKVRKGEVRKGDANLFLDRIGRVDVV